MGELMLLLHRKGNGSHIATEFSRLRIHFVGSFRESRVRWEPAEFQFPVSRIDLPTVRMSVIRFGELSPVRGVVAGAI